MRKRKPNYKAMFKCDEVRICRYPGRLFLILGWCRSTRQDGGSQWYRNGEPIHFRYLAEQVVASGRNEEELFESAKEYKRLSKRD